MKTIKILMLTALIWGGHLTQAQTYLKSAGLRLGGATSGITYKTVLGREQAAEFILSGRNQGVQINALYELHRPAQFSFDDNFTFYYGVGGHFGFERRMPNEFYDAYPTDVYYRKRTYLGLGVDMIAGLEYRIISAPLTINLDIKPYVTFLGFRHVDGQLGDISLSIKYVFNE